MIRLLSNKSSNLLLWQFFLWKRFSTTATRFFQLPAHSSNGEVSHQNHLAVTIRRSTLSKLNNFSLWRKQCAAAMKPKSVFKSYKAFNSFCFASRRWSYIKLWSELQKTVSFDCIVHFIDEENIVTYVDFPCGVNFYTEAPTKIKQINRERNLISRSS